MAKISKEQWAVIERRLLAEMQCPVVFELNGRALLPRWVKTNKSRGKFKLCVFIDGAADQYKGCPWMTCYDSFTSMVWRKRMQVLSSTFQIKREIYSPFMSATALIRQYKTIDGLEVME